MDLLRPFLASSIVKLPARSAVGLRIRKGYLDKYAKIFFILCNILIIISIAANILKNPATEAQTGDYSQNFGIAYNLAYHGTFSMERRDGQDHYQPTYHREPFPPAFMALLMKMDPRLPDDITYSQLNSPPYVGYITQYNLIFSILILICSALLVYITGGRTILSSISAICATVLIYYSLYSTGQIYKTNNTEQHAAAFIIIVSIIFYIYRNGKGWLPFLFCGIVLGILALIKASFLYVGAGFIVFFAARSLFAKERFLSKAAAMAVGLVIVTSPWMIRNYILFDRLQIRSAGGVVLLMRAYYDRMTRDEMIGALYVYAPDYLKTAYFTPVWGYSRQDLKPGEALQRLSRNNGETYREANVAPYAEDNEDDVISLYRRATKDWDRSQGAGQALTIIQEHPAAHLLTTPIFLWRGFDPIYGFYSNLRAPIRFAIESASLLCFWTFAFVGMIQNNRRLLALTLFPCGVFCFYALFSHFIPRYSVPLIPSLVVSLVVAGQMTVEWLVSLRAKRSDSQGEACPEAS